MNIKKIVILLIAGFIIASISWKVYDYQTNKNSYITEINEKEFRILDNIYISSDKNITSLNELLSENPDNAELLIKLSMVYILKANETADPKYYSSAEEILNKVIKNEPDNFFAYAMLGSVYNLRNDFKKGMELSLRSLKINPYSAFSNGVLADAQTGLGMYDEAELTIEKMKDKKPSLVVYSRISDNLDFKGDTQGAIDAMKTAISAGLPVEEKTARCRVQLGNLFYNKGDMETAGQIYGFVIKDFPEYVHGYGAMAKIKKHNKEYSEAIELYKKALEKNVLPEYLISLGDAYALSGNNEMADEQYQKARSVLNSYEQKGVNTDLDMALFNADHDIELTQSKETLERILNNGSKNIKVYDALAWINYKLGNYYEAQKNIEQALRLSTKDPLMYFHAGKIYEKTGQPDKAKEYLDLALVINPYYETLYLQK